MLYSTSGSLLGMTELLVPGSSKLLEGQVVPGEEASLEGTGEGRQAPSHMEGPLGVDAQEQACVREEIETQPLLSLRLKIGENPWGVRLVQRESIQYLEARVEQQDLELLLVGRVLGEEQEEETGLDLELCFEAGGMDAQARLASFVEKGAYGSLPGRRRATKRKGRERRQDGQSFPSRWGNSTTAMRYSSMRTRRRSPRLRCCACATP